MKESRGLLGLGAREGIKGFALDRRSYSASPAGLVQVSRHVWAAEVVDVTNGWQIQASRCRGGSQQEGGCIVPEVMHCLPSPR